ncbi:hypothetical protein RRG08_053810, partial [Elysia crispata]
MDTGRTLESLLLLTLTVTLTVGYILKDDTMREVSGRMLVLEPETGTHHRMTRRHVDLEDDLSRAVRLELGSEGINLDMTLTRRSVWTNESRAFEYRDNKLEEVTLDLDPECFMAGSLDSGEGSASFSSCDGL